MRKIKERKNPTRNGREGATYSSFENSVSVEFHTLTVSTSVPTSSSRCVVRALPSISGELPGPPTRSVMSKMMLVKPSLSMKTSWASGT